MAIPAHKIGWPTAAALVVANMVGTGAFTTLGLQLEIVQSSWTIFCLWALGGLVALSGALSYAELGTHLPRSGGEYHFLGQTIHPLAGYLSGWVSLTVGFAAPVALAAMAMADYLHLYLPASATAWAIAAVLVVSGGHSLNLRSSSLVQDALTALKVVVMLTLILAAWAFTSEPQPLAGRSGWFEELGSAGFAVALIYVTYAYSGWNAAAYIVDELDRPRKNLPKALLAGTLMVSLLYLGLQFAFLRLAPVEALRGEVEVAQVAAGWQWGAAGGRVVSLVIASLLLSSISAMVWVGPRVVRRMAEDHLLWAFLARDNAAGIPVAAIWFQALLSILMIATGSFEAVLVYSGFVLQLSTTVTVAAVFVLRRRAGGKEGYRSWGFPLPQLFFLGVSAWVLIYLLIDRPEESLFGMLNLGLGYLTYRWSRHRARA